MAFHRFTFEPDGDDPEQFFRDRVPMQLIGAINQVISLLSMPVPKRDTESIPAATEVILADEAGWLERAVGDATDFDAITEQVAEKLDEGLDMENVSATGDFFMKGARLNIRNALFFSWMALPEPRRTRPEAERIVRLAISRQLALIEAMRQELSAR
jgi:hypothetical protein